MQRMRVERDEGAMSKKPVDVKDLKIARPPRIQLSKEEIIERMKSFPEREEKFVASVRKNKN